MIVEQGALMLQIRLAAARQSLSAVGADILLFTSLPNIRYLTGFTGSDAAFLLTPELGCFLTDSRYTTQAAQEVSSVPIRQYGVKLEGVADWIREHGARRVAFEAEHASFATVAALQARLPDVELLPVSQDLDLLRCRKDEDEVAQLASVAALASSAFERLVPHVVPGATERDLALRLEAEMKALGADDRSFDFIVASGERGALPHGRASRKQLAAGELVTFDYGAVLNGYCSDETVTLCLGSPNSRQRHVYESVKSAHDLALEAVRPGVPLRELDALAREYLGRQGLGDYFGHGLGHGLGLEVHEKPVVSPRSEAVAEEGMVFTIEPGVYIPGWGGVRIEDTVVVTACGCRVITLVSKELHAV
jgi:Xaa-Pro aminopeptidase